MAKVTFSKRWFWHCSCGYRGHHDTASEAMNRAQMHLKDHPDHKVSVYKKVKHLKATIALAAQDVK
jgi:hypothetical protein